MKHTWSELGTQLSTLASLHAKKAKSYLNEVRQPLLDLTPKLEDTRKEVRAIELFPPSILGFVNIIPLD